MANLMEEKILEIISKADKGDGYFIPHVLRKKFYADDIADNFRKFTEWKDNSIDIGIILLNSNGLYSYRDSDFLILDELFDYWWNNIKDK